MSSEWNTVLIDEIRAPSPGSIAIGPFGSRMKSECYVDKGIRVVRGTNISSGRTFSGDFVFITKQKAEELGSANLRQNDLVFPHRGSIGEVGIVPGDGEKYVISSSLMKLTCDETMALPLYVYFFFKSKIGKFELLKNSSQVGTPGIGQPLTSLKSIRIPLPPLSAQAEIAGMLGALDDRICLLRETNATLEAVAHALFKSWFIDFDPVRAKQDGRVLDGMDVETAALFPDSFEETGLARRPKGWGECAVYDLATYINGAAYKAFDPNLEGRGLPIIKIAELKAGVTSQTAYSDVVMPEKYRILTGDILFSWSGNPDTSIDTFVWPHGSAWLNQHIFRVVPHVKGERAFLLRTLRYLRPVFAELARNKQTTGLGHVTVADLKRLQVVKPGDAVLESFDRVLAPVHRKMFDNDQRVQTLIALRDTLLPRLISGQLRLPDDVSQHKEAA